MLSVSYVEPRHHVIVVRCFPANGRVQVIHNTKKGVVQELVGFTPPWYRMEYNVSEVNKPDEVIRIARANLNKADWKSSKEFARSCKLK